MNIMFRVNKGSEIIVDERTSEFKLSLLTEKTLVKNKKKYK